MVIFTPESEVHLIMQGGGISVLDSLSLCRLAFHKAFQHNQIREDSIMIFAGSVSSLL